MFMCFVICFIIGDFWRGIGLTRQLWDLFGYRFEMRFQTNRMLRYMV